MKWFHEPLTHFLLIGAALFLLFGLQNGGFNDEAKRIVFTQADIDRLGTLWEKKRRRPPTQIELEGLIELRIREEVMYREALALGLDKNDPVVRRRLAQKIEFISANLATQIEPTDAELADFLAQHPDLFEVPEYIDFVQIYFNTNQREHSQDDALLLLDQLTLPDSEIEIATVGDTFMLNHQHEQLTEQEVSRLFGRDFARHIFSLPVGSWQGPVPSGYGLHLIRIDNKTPAHQLELDAVRDKVNFEWHVQRRRTVDEAFYQNLRQRYQIVIDGTISNDRVVSTK